jgi:hypothetical protein
MRIFFCVEPNGAIRMTALVNNEDIHCKLRSWSPKGDAVCGLPYEEAIQYAWIETDDDGEFVSGEKRSPPDPDFDPSTYNPPFLRKPLKPS